MSYVSFLESKRKAIEPCGKVIDDAAIHPRLFDFQKDVTKWAAVKGRCAVLLDCVAGDTLIDGPDGAERIDVLAERGRAIRVWSLDQNGNRVPALATAPFRKGFAPLTRFSLASGRSITVTARHAFLTPEGWQRAGELKIGQYLAVYAPVPQQSSAAVASSMSPEGGLHSSEIGEGSLWHCSVYSRQRDRLLPPAEGTDQDASPSQDDVLALAPPLLRKDAQACTKARNHHRPENARLSMPGSTNQGRNMLDEQGYLLHSSDSRWSGESTHSAVPMAQGANLRQSTAVSHPSVVQSSERVPVEASPLSYDTIVSIQYTTDGPYYDLHVPLYENYLANGIWNHNTGLGKTFVQIEWARQMNERTLILAPLSVARQTTREGRKIDADVRYVRSQAEVTGDHKLWITNYEVLDSFDFSKFGAVVLDESSLLKCLTGVTRQKLTDVCAHIPYRLCCTATPAPNDYTELGNHAHFLGICTMAEMLSMFFINANKQQTVTVDGRVYETKGSNKGGQEWRLKHHAEERFFQWLASWAITMTKPSDLGYSDDGFVLPPLNVTPHFVRSDYISDGQLFFSGLKGITNRVEVRRGSLEVRLEKLKELVAGSNEQAIIWVGLDDESKAVKEAFGERAIEVKGSDSPEYKAAAFEAFQDGNYPILLTKGKIGGFGLNLQNASRMFFFGLSDSWETFYQCVRREWRYGQQRPVDVHIVMSDAEDAVYHNVMRKDAMAARLRQKLVAAVRDYERSELGMTTPLEQAYETADASGQNWRLMLGDSCERLKELPDESIDMSVYSPPFEDLFTYSASDRDLGNSRGRVQFFDHYAFIIREVLRVTKPGRLTCVHTSDIPAMQSRDGWIGVKDFPGDVIRAHIKEGWDFHGRASIPKNPQAQAIRTHSQALLFVQLRKDSTASRPALIDQVLLFRKPGENDVPVTPVDNGEMDNETWIEWANGVWIGISESDTLSVHAARVASDEKHICALQLGTIERCVKLYSNPGELVLSPFAGIGSEGYVAVRYGRRFVGCELKPSYFQTAVKNLAEAEQQAKTPDLFAWAEAQEVAR